MRQIFLALLSAATVTVYGQMTRLPQVPTTGWNSSFEFSPEQIELGSLSPGIATTLENILNFDRTQLANGGTTYDSFYTLLNGTSKPQGPGQVLKVEKFTDTTPYNLPSGIAMSRIVYSSMDLNGTLVPASAFVLWPWTPKTFGSSKSQCEKKAPVILWTHGTSGTNADGAPSAHRSLFYGEYMPAVLAQAGYAVIAPDYAGLGVERSWDGSFVPHQYLAREASASDALNALRAARKTFSNLIHEEYVVVGHSQGGNTASGTMELLGKDGNEFKDVETGHLDKVFPGFKLEDWLSPLGISRVKLLTAVKGGQFFTQALFNNATENLNPKWNETWYANSFFALSNPGDRPWKGPAILFHGTEDIAANYNRSIESYRSTCKKYPGNFEFVTLPHATHFGGMDITRERWLNWIKDRFEMRPLENPGCQEEVLESFLPVEHYQRVGKYFSQWSAASEWAYQVPQGL